MSFRSGASSIVSSAVADSADDVDCRTDPWARRLGRLYTATHVILICWLADEKDHGAAFHEVDTPVEASRAVAMEFKV
jgi:hypothetical protein